MKSWRKDNENTQGEQSPIPPQLGHVLSVLYRGCCKFSRSGVGRGQAGCAVMGREYNPYTYSLKVPPETDNKAQGTAIKEDVSPELVVLTLKTVAEEQPET